MTEQHLLAEQFESTAPHLRAVAYRMLGSLSEAEDARAGGVAAAQPVRHGGGRQPRRLADDGRRPRLPRHAARAARAARGLRRHAARADRRLDDDDRPRGRGAARRLGRPGAACRARDADAGRAARVRAARHVRRAVRRDRADRRPHPRTRRASSRAAPGAACAAPRRRPDADLARQREVVDAFLAASRAGDFDALRRGARPGRRLPRRRGPAAADCARPPCSGAEAVARSLLERGAARSARPAGARQRRRRARGRRPGRPLAVAGFTVASGRIVAIDLITDPEKLARLGSR